MLTVHVYRGTGYVMALRIAEMEAMKRPIADLNVVSILIFSLLVGKLFLEY